MDVTPLNTASQAVAPSGISISHEQQAQNRQLIQAVHAANAAELFGEDSQLTFAIGRGTERPVIRIVNRKTKEMVRRISAEDLLRVAESMRDGSETEST